MNKGKYLVFALLGVLFLGTFSCKKKAEAPKETESTIFRSELTHQDTVDATAISTKFMETLKAGNVEEALNQLVLVDTARKVVALPDETKQTLSRRFTSMPVKDFLIDTFEFYKPDSNLVVFSYVFAEAPEGQKAPTMRFATMPMKLDGKWYLTLPGYTETNGVKIKTEVPSEEKTDSVK